MLIFVNFNHFIINIAHITSYCNFMSIRACYSSFSLICFNRCASEYASIFS